MRRVFLGLLLFSSGIQSQLYAQITNYPYVQDFESGYAGWTVDGVSPSWELGAPNNILINSAASGTNAIVTNLTGTYNNQENSWVESPPFDLSGLTNPYVQFNILFDIESGWDGAVVQSSIDNGSSWQNVGSFLGGINWYQLEGIFAMPGGQDVGWSGSSAGLSPDIWLTAIHEIFDLAGETNVIFRVAFASDSINIPEGYEGFAFDNFSILENPCYAGNDVEVSLCYNENIVNLYQYLFNADSGGTWSTNGPLAITSNGDINIQDTAFLPETSFEFIYTVTSENGACTDSAKVYINVQEPYAIDSSTLDVCASLATEQDLLEAVGDPNGDGNGIWYDSDNQVIDFNQTPEVGAGTYTYEIPPIGVCPSQSETVEVIVDEPEPWAGGSYDDFAGRSLNLTQRSFPIFGNLFELLAGIENLQAPTGDEGGDWEDSEYGCGDESFDCETGDYDFRSLGPGNYQVSFTYKVDSGSCGPSEFVVNLDVDVPFFGTNGTLQWCDGDVPFTENDLLGAINGNVNDTQGFWTPSAADPSFGEAGDYIYEAGNTDTVTVTVEFINCPSEIAAKIWLEGPYESGLMNDDLRVNGLISIQTPYVDGATVSADILNDGGASQTGLPQDNIVDWVWVELRDANDNTNILYSKSALLQRDGDIVGLDGISPLRFTVPYDDYYLAVAHRNHLGILTSNVITINGETSQQDLSSNPNLIQGDTNAVQQVDVGAWALFTGDYNGDGQVQNTDRDSMLPLLGLATYSYADLDMNGQIQNTDINLLMPNIGRGAQARAALQPDNEVVIIAPRRH